MMFEMIAITIAAVLFAGHLVTIALYQARLDAPPRRMSKIGLPPLTVLRPVVGSDPLDAETLGSTFAQDYPDYEVIFCVPSDRDASLPLLRRLIAENPLVPARILTGQVPRSGNPKLDNLWKGWDAATTDYVVMTDSNLLMPPTYLRQLAAQWDEGTGLVSCPAIGIRPQGFAASLECAFLNSNQARLQFAAASLGRGFAQGKTLFWNRPMLNAAGGLDPLGRNLAEDVSATKLVRSWGLSVRLPNLPFAQPIGRRTLDQVWQRQLRWSRVRRDGFPGLFLGEPVNGSVLAMIAFALALGHASLVWMIPALVLWYGAEVWLMVQAGWPAGWRDILALPVRDAMMPALWAATFLRKGFDWRGTEMSGEGVVTL